MENGELGPINKKSKKVTIIAIVVGVIIVLGTISTMHNMRVADMINTRYSELVQQADASMNSKDYGKAIELYNEALTVKDGEDAKAKLSAAKSIMESNASLKKAFDDSIAAIEKEEAEKATIQPVNGVNETKLTKEQALEKIYAVDPDKKGLLYICNEGIFSDDGDILQGSNDIIGHYFYAAAWESGGNALVNVVDAYTGEVYEGLGKENGKQILALVTNSNNSEIANNNPPTNIPTASNQKNKIYSGHWSGDTFENVAYINSGANPPAVTQGQMDIYIHDEDNTIDFNSNGVNFTRHYRETLLPSGRIELEINETNDLMYFPDDNQIVLTIKFPNDGYRSLMACHLVQD